MTGKRQRLGVLFADICDSSRLYESLGDEPARRLVTASLDRLSASAENRGGRVVDRIGDEVMCVFDSPEDTLLGAIDMQADITRADAAGELEVPLTVRVGFHFGGVIVDGERIFGSTVYTARRMASLAKGSQILATQETVARLRKRIPVISRLVNTVSLEGKRGRFEVHELIWEQTDATICSDAVLHHSDPGTLVVEHDGKSLRLDAERPQLTMGRGSDRDLVIDKRAVSRHHARIEMRTGHFALCDQSTNGTLVKQESGEWIPVHRDELRLEDAGTIVLGPLSRNRRGRTLTFRLEKD